MLRNGLIKIFLKLNWFSMQGYISKSLEGLDFAGKYKLSDYLCRSAPLVMFGMYREEDYDIFKCHKGEITVVWQGMDARSLSSPDIIKGKRAKHYSISHWIKESLDDKGIENEYFPIHATVDNGQRAAPMGMCMYFYSNDCSDESLKYYGYDIALEVSERTGIELVHCTLTSLTKKNLHEAYKNCFVNLRLTSYDGCPNTNLEMGLMGRRSIFNGDITHSIKWETIDDVCWHVLKEFENRHDGKSKIVNDIVKFINQPNQLFL
jgi:hypothetical protein